MTQSHLGGCILKLIPPSPSIVFKRLLHLLLPLPWNGPKAWLLPETKTFPSSQLRHRQLIQLYGQEILVLIRDRTSLRCDKC